MLARWAGYRSDPVGGVLGPQLKTGFLELDFDLLVRRDAYEAFGREETCGR